MFGAVEMAVFLAILLIGYFYAWKRKVLSWV
jgi:NADH:ubiquinone oxidoreductase subunit 3 (subunit A)